MVSMEKKITYVIFPLVHIIGKFRELEIIINNVLIKKCMKCLKECPVGTIIVKNDVMTIDKQKCIHCYHCTID